MTDSIMLGNINIGVKKGTKPRVSSSGGSTKVKLVSVKPAFAAKIKASGKSGGISKAKTAFLKKKATNFKISDVISTETRSAINANIFGRSSNNANNKDGKNSTTDRRQGNNSMGHKRNSNEAQSKFKKSKLFDGSLRDIKEIDLSKTEPNQIPKDVKQESLFSGLDFSDLKFNSMLVACLQQRFSLTNATNVQVLSIPPLLEGKDALIKSATGSGKTLAYAIPLVHRLQSFIPRIDRTHGLQALIILPTRELALQTYDCLDQLLNPFRRIVLGILIGGEKKKSEKARIRKGINILVTTPGRLLDHLNSTINLRFEQLKWFVIDEADRLYEQGFSAIMGQIIEQIQRACTVNPIQTVLLSATLSEGVKELAGLSLKNPEIIDVGDDSENGEHRLETIVLPSSLENCYLIVPPKLRLVTLSCIIINSFAYNGSDGVSKIVVFMSCQDVVDFYSTLLNLTLHKFLDKEEGKQIKILQLRGNMNQVDRTQVFKKFHAAKCGILFCTDVASRGLDLPNVDLVLQTSIPPLPEDYVHRVGRTARVGCKGRSIMMVLPSETEFVGYLQHHISVNFTALRIEDIFKCVNSLNFSDNANLYTDQERLAHLQHLFEETIYADEQLREMAGKAYLSHLRAYASYPHKMARLLPFKMLHLGHIAKSFALREAPSDLGGRFQRTRKLTKSKIQDTSSKRRRVVPLEDRVSEFSGGSVSIGDRKGRQRQRTIVNNY